MDTGYSSQEMCNFGTPLFKIFSGKYRDNIVGNFHQNFLVSNISTNLIRKSVSKVQNTHPFSLVYLFLESK